MKKLGAGALALGLLAGCSDFRTGGNIGGANMGAKRPGNVPGGIAVKSGDIAVDPNNHFFVTLRGSTVVIGSVADQNASPLESIPRPDRLAFWEDSSRDGFVVLSTPKDLMGNPTGNPTVVSYDRNNNREIWRKDLSGTYKRLDVATGRVILTGQDVKILNAETGEVAGTYAADGVAIRDVKVIGGGSKMVVVEENKWDGANPTVHMSVRNTDDGTQVCETTASNCSDEVVVSEDESRVFLAPTLCAQDPITVMGVKDGNCEIEKQMPGFGPVALSPKGNLIVAFLDRDAQEPNGTVVPDHVKNSNQRYHLMMIDPATLDYTTMGAGDELPRYVFTPDGERLLVDSPMEPFSKIRVVDIASGHMRSVSGPPVKLNVFTLSPDSVRAYVADNQLFHLDIPGARIRPVGFGFPPSGINRSVDGATVLVTKVTDRIMVFFDAAQVREQNRIVY